MKDPIKDKSKAFSLSIIKLYKFLTEEKREFILSKQILRSGTSIGANIAEAKGAESKADFTHKLRIAYKESLETKYWLELLYDGQYISKEGFKKRFQMADNLAGMIFKSIKTTKKKS